MILKCLSFKSQEYPTLDLYPFSLHVFQDSKKITFSNPVTFFSGENGTGKSTLLKAIAKRCNIHIWDESGKTQLKYNPYTEELYKFISLTWYDGVVGGSFFGAEIFKKFAILLDEWAKTDPGVLDYFGGQSLTTKSHGQSNMQFFANRFNIKGLYLLDEPESALSPKTQLELLKIIRDAVAAGNAQFIIATHSPILMSYQKATIFSFDDTTIKNVLFEDTECFKVYKDFMTNPKKYRSNF